MPVYKESSENYPIGTSLMLNMPPAELAEYTKGLDEEGMLEEFLDEAVENDQLIAHLSYWEKWFPGKIRKLIDEKISAKRKDLIKREDCLPLDLESRFSEEELKHLFSQHGALQLTFGCSKACRTCCFDAVPKVRDEIPFAQIENLFKKYGEGMGESEWLCYHASEPNDYEHYPEVHNLAVKYGEYFPEITTSEADDENWLRFLRNNTRSYIRMSLMSDDERFQNFAKSIIEPQIEVIVNGKPVKIETKQQRNFHEATPQEKHTKGVGLPSQYTKNVKKAAPDQFGRLCGPLITPRGIYNVFQTEISERYPQGQIVVPIGPLSDKPIEVGQSLQDVFSSNLILSHTHNLGCDYCCVYNKSGIYKVFYKDDIVVDSKKIENILPDDGPDLEKYLEDLKIKALENPQMHGDLDHNFIDIVKKYLNLLVLDKRRSDLHKIDPQRVAWSCTLDPSDVPEIIEPIHVILDYHLDIQASFLHYEKAEDENEVRYPEDEEKYSQQTKRLIKEALEEGAICVDSDRWKETIDHQKLIDKIYNSDLSDLRIVEPEEIFCKDGEPCKIKRIKWEWLFIFNDEQGREIYTTFCVYLKPETNSIKLAVLMNGWCYSRLVLF
jgi:hypothetical protein